jgi:hypothetical protein
MSDNYLVLKVAGGIVLGLFVWTGIERYQQRRAFEAAMQELERISADPDPMGIRRKIERNQAEQRRLAVAQRPKPVPGGFRCVEGSLLKRIDGGWMQVTSRHNEWFCPHGGTVNDCYQVTAKSVGCQ